MLRGRGAENPRIGLLTHPQRDPGFEHGIDIKIVTIKLSFQPDRAADPHAADQPPNSVAQNICAAKRFLDQARIAGPRGDLAYRGPLRSLDAVRTIPFGISSNHDATLVRRDRARATDLAVILQHIGTERGLIRIVPLLDARRVNGEIE